MTDEPTPSDPPPVPKGITVEELQSHLTKLETKLTEAHDKRGAEWERTREALEARIKEVEGQLAAERKAQDNKDKATSGGGTIVVPPTDVQPAQQHAPSGEPEPAPSGPQESRKGRGWKGIW